MILMPGEGNPPPVPVVEKPGVSPTGEKKPVPETGFWTADILRFLENHEKYEKNPGEANLLKLRQWQVEKKPPEEKKGKEPPPAPVPKKEPPPTTTPTPDTTVDMPTELTTGLVSLKHRTGRKGEKGEVIEEEMEVVEEKAREAAGARMTEGEKQWRGKTAWIKQFVPRYWKYNIGTTGTYGKEKIFEQKMHAEAGLQVHGMKYEFEEKVMQLAAENIAQRRKGRLGLRRLGGGLKDVWHEFTFTEKELHQESLAIIAQLRKAAETPNDPEIKDFLTKNGALVAEYTDIRLKDFQDAQSAAEKLTSRFGDEVIHEMAGEMRGTEALLMTGEVRDYLVNNVIKKILADGLLRGDGSISVETEMQAVKAMQDFFFTPQFAKWHKEQLASSDEKVRKAAESFKYSLSYGSDLIKFTKEVMLTKALQAKDHFKSTENLDEYMKKLVLKVQLGTLEGDQKGTQHEGGAERRAGRSIDNARVQALYEKLASEGNAPTGVPDRYLNAATGRANALRRMIDFNTNYVSLGALTGVGLWVGQRALGWGAGLAAPVVGGSVVSGFFRYRQEGAHFTREYEQHGIEEELGYKHFKDAFRRSQMERIKVHTKEMEVDLTAKMQERIKSLKEKNITDQQVLELMALTADTQARFNLMDQRGIGLLSAGNPQAYQTEKTNLEFTKAEAKQLLGEYFTEKPDKLGALRTKFNMAAGVTGDQMLDELTREQMNILVTGVGANANYQAALGEVKIDEKDALEAKERAFNSMRRYRQALYGLTTAAFGMGGFIATRGPVTWALQRMIEHNVPVAGGFLELMGWAKVRTEAPDPNATPIDINGQKIRLPRGFDFRNGHIIDTKTGEDLVDTTKGGTLLSRAAELKQKGIDISQGLDQEVSRDITILNKSTGWDPREFTMSGHPIKTMAPKGPGWHSDWQFDPTTKKLDLLAFDDNNRIIDYPPGVSHSGHVTLINDADFTFDAAGKMHVNYDSAGSVIKLANTEFNPAGYDAKGFNPDWVKNLQAGQEVAAGGFSFKAENIQNGQGILRIYDSAYNLIGTVKDLTVNFQKGQAFVSYDGVPQNTVPSNVLDALQKAGAVVKNDNFWPPRVSTQDWNTYLASLGSGKSFVSDPSVVLDYPSTPSVPWPNTPSGEHFPYTNIAFSHFFENGHLSAKDIFARGEIDVMNGQKVIRWDNGAISFPPKDVADEFTDAFAKVKSGGPEAAKMLEEKFHFYLGRPAPAADDFNEGWKAAILTSKTTEVDAPTQFKDQVWASYGFFGSNGKVYKIAGFGPTEHLKNLLFNGPSEKIAKYEMSLDLKDGLTDKIKDKIPTYLFGLKKLEMAEAVGIPMDWPRRPLERPEGVRKTGIPASIPGRGQYTGQTTRVTIKGKKKEETEEEDQKPKEEDKTEAKDDETKQKNRTDKERQGEESDEVSDAIKKKDQELTKSDAKQIIQLSQQLGRRVLPSDLTDNTKRRAIAEELVFLSLAETEMTQEEKDKIVLPMYKKAFLEVDKDKQRILKKHEDDDDVFTEMEAQWLQLEQQNKTLTQIRNELPQIMREFNRQRKGKKIPEEEFNVMLDFLIGLNIKAKPEYKKRIVDKANTLRTDYQRSKSKK